LEEGGVRLLTLNVGELKDAVATHRIRALRHDFDLEIG
jgi:hypothetical protein